MRERGIAAHIVGIGGTAGDDRVGLAVVAALRRRGVPPAVELLEIADPTLLTSLLDDDRPLVLIDAVLARPAGRVLDLEPRDLACLRRAPASSHGVSVAQAIELARHLRPQGLPPVRLVVVTIDPPAPGRLALSPAVARAVPRAVARVLAALELPA